MERGNEWRALPACGKVSAAKIANGKDACALGEQGEIDQLDAVLMLGGVADGLPVAADGGDVFRLHLAVGKQLVDGLGVDVAELLGEDLAAVQFVFADVLQGEQFGFQAGGVGDKAVGDGALPLLALHGDEYGICAVHAGA